jgi:hypothetical protein
MEPAANETPTRPLDFGKGHHTKVGPFPTHMLTAA